MVLVQAAKGRELGDWEMFEGFVPWRTGTPSKAIANTRWALTWQMVEGERDVDARLVVKGNSDPALTSLAEVSWCVGLSPPHLQAKSLIVLEEWRLRNLGMKGGSPEVDGSDRELHLRAPQDRNPLGAQRIRKRRAPAYGSNDAPAACRETLDCSLLRKQGSLALVSLKLRPSSFDPGFFCIPCRWWRSGGPGDAY